MRRRLAIRLHGAAAVSPRRAPRRRRNRGFSLLIVFLLVALMLGVAAPVLLTTQEDLAVAGQDRESLTAFYAAEYAVAQAKDWVATQMHALDPNLSRFASVGWSPLLAAAATLDAGCASGPAQLATSPIKPKMDWRDFNGTRGVFTIVPGSNDGPGNGMFRYCVHNNSEDPAYLDSTGSFVAACKGKNGDVDDSCDVMHQITIEAWGAFPVDPTTHLPVSGAATTHLTVNLGPPTLRSVSGTGTCSYGATEGGCGSHAGNGGIVDSTTVSLPR